MPEIIVPDEYLREIGRVAAYWNELESLMHHTLVLALLGDFAKDGRAISVFVHMAFNQKLDALSSMLRIIDDGKEALAAVYRDEVQPLLKQAQEKRNAVLHQSLLVQDGVVQKFNIKARGVLKITLFPITVQELEGVSEFIRGARGKLLQLIAAPLGDMALRQSAKNDPQHGQ
jgi:hypothetical protein